MYKSPFKWWVQSVMPVVFDDSLSYYEVLAKLTKYIEGLTGDVQEIEKILGTIEGIEDVAQFTEFLEKIQVEIGDLANLSTQSKTNLVSAINEIALKADIAYYKPPTGIPESDLSQGVQDKLNRTVDDTKYIINNRELKASPSNNSPADLGLGTYSVPAGGIPWDTLSQDVKDRINAGGSGTGGTTDYTDLNNKPQINGHTLNAGNNTAESLGLGTYSKPDTGIPETDLSAEVQEKLNTSGGIADNETSFVTTRDYEAGELIYINGVLYKTKYKILSGTNLIPGNNIEVTDISAEIERINNDIDALQSGSGPDSWNLTAEVKSESSSEITNFFEYFNCIGGENYNFILDPVEPTVGYSINICKRDGTVVHSFDNTTYPNYTNRQRFTFTPNDTGEYYCTIRRSSASGATIAHARVTIEYTQSQGISELWAQVNSASQLGPRVGALETLAGDLDENVTSLKSAINQLFETRPESIDTSFDSQGLSDFWNAGYISLSGTITEQHATYRYSDIIPVSEGDTLIYNNLRAIGSNYALIATYKSDGTYVQSKSVAGTGQFEQGSYIVPSEIAKIRVSWYWSTNYICALTVIKHTPITDRLDTEIDELDTEIDELNAQMKTIVPRDFDDLEFTEQYVDNNGNIVNRGTITNRLSNKIYNLGRDITYANIRGLVNRGYALAAFGFDDKVIPSKSIITDGISGSGAYFTASGTFSFTDDVAYIRLSYYIYKQPTMSASWFEEINSFDYIESLIDGGGKQWNGKSWVAFGTSITDTNNALAPDGTATGKYVPYLKALSGMTVTNYGIAGASIGYNEGYVSGAILTKIKSPDSLPAIQSADLITIEGFVNDFVGNVPIGQLGDTTNLTLIGAIYDAVTYISQQNPNATIVLLTDTTGRNTETGDLPITRQNALDKYQYEYIDAIVSIGKYLNIPVINCGQKSQINQWHTQYLIDHIHQTELGGAQYAATIWDELKNIINFECRIKKENVEELINDYIIIMKKNSD